MIIPSFGWNYSSRINDSWRFRFGTYLIVPFKLEWAYTASPNIELSIGLSMAGWVSCNILF
jgi:hypothetical protein